MNHKHRGYALIFNHEYFDPKLIDEGNQLRRRNGTHTDRENLKKCLQNLGFDVHIFDDFTRLHINEKLEECKP